MLGTKVSGSITAFLAQHTEVQRPMARRGAISCTWGLAVAALPFWELAAEHLTGVIAATNMLPSLAEVVYVI